MMYSTGGAWALGIGLDSRTYPNDPQKYGERCPGRPQASAINAP